MLVRHRCLGRDEGEGRRRKGTRWASAFNIQVFHVMPFEKGAQVLKQSKQPPTYSWERSLSSIILFSSHRGKNSCIRDSTPAQYSGHLLHGNERTTRRSKGREQTHWSINRRFARLSLLGSQLEMAISRVSSFGAKCGCFKR